MARSLNQCNFIGNLGKDPETSYLPSGKAVTKISIAVSDDYKDNQTGQKVEKTNWVPVVAFDRLAEIIGEYCVRGSKVFVSGKFQTRSWDKDDGTKGYATEIIANDLQMLDSRADSDAPAQRQERGANNPGSVGSNGQAKTRNHLDAQQTGQGIDDFDDTIPF